MDLKIIDQIKEVIKTIKKEYEDIIIDYHYDSDEDIYLIYHNNSELHYNNSEFLDFVGGSLRKYILDKDIYNVGFAYDYEFDIESRKESKWYKPLDKIDNSVTYNYNTIKKTIDYKPEFSLDKTKGINPILDKIYYDQKCESNKKKSRYNMDTIDKILKSEYLSEFSLFENNEQDDDAA